MAHDALKLDSYQIVKYFIFRGKILKDYQRIGSIGFQSHHFLVAMIRKTEQQIKQQYVYTFYPYENEKHADRIT